eukprot:1107029-Amorphochlora_amoeboformis.AAC.1
MEYCLTARGVGAKFSGIPGWLGILVVASVVLAGVSSIVIALTVLGLDGDAARSWIALYTSEGTCSGAGGT